MPSLTSCRSFPGDLAGPGRHQLSTPALRDAHRSCSIPKSRGPGSSAAPVPAERLAQPGQLWDSGERVPGSPSPLLVPTNGVSGSHSVGEGAEVVYSCQKGGTDEELRRHPLRKRKKPARCYTKLLFACWPLVLDLENRLEISYGGLSSSKPTVEKKYVLLPSLSI